LPDQSVHAVATSPPFFGLRDYGTGEWEGGDPDCDHRRERGERGNSRQNLAQAATRSDGSPRSAENRSDADSGLFPMYRDVCGKCGAERVDRQIGLEASPEAWAEALVAVFREARRVLRDDGTLWLEVGDSYADRANRRSDGESFRSDRADCVPEKRNVLGGDLGLKAQDLIGVPWLLAFALRADGWWLRGAYVWEKPDAMPESVTDRCVVSHSFVFQLAKSGRPTFWTHRDGRGARRKPAPDYVWINRETGEESREPVEGWRRVNLWRGRDYFFDLDAIREPFSDYSTGGGREAKGGDGRYQERGHKTTDERNARFQGPARPRSVDTAQLTVDGEEVPPEVRGPDGRREFQLTGQHNSEQHRDGSRWPSLEGRSPRSVWRIPTEASSFGLCPACRTYWDSGAPARHCGVDVVAHFAVWPHELVRRIVACATSEGGSCGECGAPRVRATRKYATGRVRNRATGGLGAEYRRETHGLKAVEGTFQEGVVYETTGWHPSCACDAETVPCVVLDPFAGSGTTARQARKMGRYSILIELSLDYAEIASHRLAQQSLLGATP